MLPYILFEKCIYILALEMASRGNQHCANCIGILSFLAGVSEIKNVPKQQHTEMLQ